MIAGTRVEPLRGDNPDFDIVGPGWLSIAVFGVLVVAHGMCVAALAGRYSRVLPLLSRRVPSILAHAPLLLVAPMAPVLVPVTLVGLVTVLAARVRPLVSKPLESRSFTLVGRVVLGAALVLALPGFVSTVSAIVSRGP